MAKIAKKKGTTAVNPRSRAAKRASSPSINVDKSIKDAPRADGASPMLGISQNSGVTKKRKAKPMTRGQRMRQERGLARAEVVMDQMEKKVDGVKAKLKKRNLRKSLWEDVNETTADETRKAPKLPGKVTAIGDVNDQENEQLPATADTNMDNTKFDALAATSADVIQQDTVEHTKETPNGHVKSQDELDLIT